MEEKRRKPSERLRQNPVSKMLLDISWIHSYASAGGWGIKFPAGEE